MPPYTTTELRPRVARLPVSAPDLCVELRSSDASYPAAVRNLSRFGVGLVTPDQQTFSPGTQVELHGLGALHATQAIATIVWQDGEESGLRVERFVNERSESAWLDVLTSWQERLTAGDIMVPALSTRLHDRVISEKTGLEEVLAFFEATPGGTLAVSAGEKVVGVLGAAEILPWIQARAKMEKENQQRRFTRLMGLAVHDLANPIAAAQSTIELLSCGMMSPEQFVREGLHAIAEKNCQRALDEIQDLLTLTRSQGGLLRLLPSKFDLIALAREVIESHKARACAKGIQLSFEGAEAAPILADQNKIRRVLSNLVSNALKYSSRDDQVVVRGRMGSDGVELCVVDTGMGIASEDLPHVFEPLSSLGGAPTGGEASHGIGLSVAHAIVEAHGGTITVESVINEGTTFTVRLPIRD